MTPADTVTHTATVFGLTTDQLCSPARHRPLVHARGAAVWTIRKVWPSATYTSIGRLLGGRDRTTVTNALALAEYHYERDATYRTMCDTLREKCYQTAA